MNSVPNRMLQMCLDCNFSSCQAEGRLIFFYCMRHNVRVFYNETCGEWEENQEAEKRVKFTKIPKKPSIPLRDLPP